MIMMRFVYVERLQCGLYAHVGSKKNLETLYIADVSI